MRLRSRLVGLAATLALAGIVAVVPIALVTLGAELVPHALPTWDQLRDAVTAQDDGTLALGAVTLIAWVAWAVLAFSILMEIASRLRGVTPPRLPGLRVPQLAARHLVAAAALLFALAPVATTSQAAASPAREGASYASIHVAAPTAPPAEAAAPPANAAGRPGAGAEAAASSSDGNGSTYTVRRGDSLSKIARDQLGDANRWPDLVALNPVVADDPDLIYAGTVLRLPVTATVSAEASRSTYTVRRGDSLSKIARDQLGDANRWPDLVALNPLVADDPDLIYAGTVLHLPPAEVSDDGAAAVVREPAGTATTQVAPAAAGSVEQPPGAAGLHTSSGAPALDGHASAQDPPDAVAAPAAADAIPAGAALVTAVDDDGVGDPGIASWALAGLTGGGALLAGSLLLALRRRRRAQLRHRWPGRTFAAPDPVLAPVEKTIVAIGTITDPTVEYVDAVLRRLAASAARDHVAIPDVAAVQLTATNVMLHLATADSLPAPWRGSDDGYHWELAPSEALDDVGPEVADQPAPYPLLVTVGTGDDESMWLLNLEDVHVTIAGDPAYGLDFARHLVADVACNPWASGARVDLLGVADELVALNPDRVRAHNAGGGDEPIGTVLAEAVRTIDRAIDAGLGVATARASQAGADAWPARLLLVDATTRHPALDRLVELLRTHAGRTGTCVVVDGARDDRDGLVIELTPHGRVRIPAVGLDLVAVGLTADEAAGCAALLAHCEDTREAPMPVDADATDGWRAWVDAAGAIRAEHTLPREAEPESPASPAVALGASLLEEPDPTYLDAAAVTVEDLNALAPRVPLTVRKDVEAVDTTLDDDVAVWFAESSPLPKLRLLGPVRATTRGTPLVKRKPYMTELLTFIALKPHGATPGEVADAFATTTAKAREYVRIVRDWLGRNPRTGEPHLPDARLARGAAHRGTPVYEVQDLLIDLDLFRRLRLRAQARGAEGVEDLRTALRLVDGRPFDFPLQRRAGGGWTWLIDGDRLDEYAAVAVVDVAHVLVTHALAAGDVATARMAAETAVLAAPHEEIPRLDLAAVAHAEGRQAEAQRVLRDEISNRSDDEGAPPELSERTQAILKRRQDWFDSAAS